MLAIMMSHYGQLVRANTKAKRTHTHTHREKGVGRVVGNHSLGALVDANQKLHVHVSLDGRVGRIVGSNLLPNALNRDLPALLVFSQIRRAVVVAIPKLVASLDVGVRGAVFA